MSEPLLVCVVELGGYPDFTPLYRHQGYRVESVTSGRKANTTVKKLNPDVLVTEFNYQHSFRDRTSSLESLLAVMQHHPSARIVVFHDASVLPQLETVRERFPGFVALPYPVDEVALAAAITRSN